MAVQALYRKWRPRTFDEVVGQEHVVGTLRNALSSGRIHHAYLFAGPRGTGKTTTARLLAKAVNCLAPEDQRPCNECVICQAVNEGRLLDLIEIDAASNTGVDDVRELRERVGFRPNEARYKVYVIDECFRYGELVTLADGSKMPIGRVVEQDLSVEVLSYNEQTGEIEPKPVIRCMKKTPHLPTVCITFDNNRKVVCTLNHKFYTPKGLKHAGELDEGQFVYANYERITQQQLAVIAGTALGDGHIALTGSRMRARLSMTQGVDQKEYLDYKAHLLGDLVAAAPTHQHFEGTYSTRGTFHLSTLSRPQIAQLHRELYGQGRKRVSRSYLDHLTPLGLTLWYLDDGSLVTDPHYHTRKDRTVTSYPVQRSTLSTHGLSHKEAHLVMQWLGERWNIDGGVSKTAKGPVIWLTKKGTERLHEVIAPYVPPSMDYKLLEAYRGQFDPPTDDGTRAGLAVSVVKAIQRVASPEFVYNIEVADNHNYFVRDILVANCHMLSGAAFNALLKTLEEPPPHAIFVLATTEPHKIPTTVVSRCQRFNFRRLPVGEVVARLEWMVEQEHIPADREALTIIARQATGSMRDAESMLDQLASYDETGITGAEVRAALGTGTNEAVVQVTDALAKGDVAQGLGVINTAVDEGADPRQFARQMVEHLRALLLLRLESGVVLAHVSDDLRPRLEAQASAFSTQALARAVRLFNQAVAEAKGGWQPQLPLEMAFIEAALPPEAEGVAPASRNQPPPAKSRTPPSARHSTASSSASVSSSPTSPRTAKTVREPEATYHNSAPGDTLSLSTSLTPKALRDRWPEVLEALRIDKHNLPLEAFMRSCEPISVDGDIIVLGFAYDLHRSKVEQSREDVEEVFSELIGQRYRVRCVVSQREHITASPQHPTTEMEKDKVVSSEGQVVSDDPLVIEGLKLGAVVRQI